jgi:hypothetical protein
VKRQRCALTPALLRSVELWRCQCTGKLSLRARDSTANQFLSIGRPVAYEIASLPGQMGQASGEGLVAAQLLNKGQRLDRNKTLEGILRIRIGALSIARRVRK